MGTLEYNSVRDQSAHMNNKLILQQTIIKTVQTSFSSPNSIKNTSNTQEDKQQIY